MGRLDGFAVMKYSQGRRILANGKGDTGRSRLSGPNVPPFW